MCEYIITEDFSMDKYIYDDKHDKRMNVFPN